MRYSRQFVVLPLTVIMATQPVQVATVMLDDFESSQWSSRAASPLSSSFRLVVGPAGQGKVGQFQFYRAGQPADVLRHNSKALQVINTHGAKFTGLSFRCRGDGSLNSGVVQFGAYTGTVRFVACFPLRNTNWHEVNIPWTEFEDVWDQVPDPGAKFDFAQLEFLSFGCRRKTLPHFFEVDDLMLATFETLAAARPPTGKPFAHLELRLAQKKPVRYVAIGDSITVRARGWLAAGTEYHQLLARQLTERFGSRIDVVNGGVNGDTAMEARIRLDCDCLAHQPDLVTIFLGANDIGYNLSRRAYRHALEMMIRDIRSLTEADIVLITPTPWRGREAISAQLAETVRQLGRDWEVPVADAAATIQALGPRSKDCYADEVHLNKKGHQLVAGALWSNITTATSTLCRRIGYDRKGLYAADCGCPFSIKMNRSSPRQCGR